VRLNVTFRSALPFDDNAHPYGEELAKYLSEKLTAVGIRITQIDNYNDFAWSLDTTVNEKPLFLLLGHVGDGDYEWLMQINAYNASFWDMFRWSGIAVAERQQLAPLVHAVLAADSTFSKIRWHIGDFAEEGYTAIPG
jgi:hypothetical protein